MENFKQLVETIEFLRSEKGCPWDRAQTLESYKKYLLEELYELFDAIEKKDSIAIVEELGDVLLNILLMATILKEETGIGIDNILINLKKKIILRHPHVFGQEKEYDIENSYKKWVNEKRKNENKGLFSDIPLSSPSLILAYLISKRAEKIGFGFEDIQSIYKKIQEEEDELKKALEKKDKKLISDELGDLLLSIVNLSTFLDTHPEEALRNTCLKFLKRLQFIENKLLEENKNFFEVDREVLEELWEKSKK